MDRTKPIEAGRKIWLVKSLTPVGARIKKEEAKTFFPI